MVFQREFYVIGERLPASLAISPLLFHTSVVGWIAASQTVPPVYFTTDLDAAAVGVRGEIQAPFLFIP